MILPAWLLLCPPGSATAETAAQTQEAPGPVVEAHDAGEEAQEEAPTDDAGENQQESGKEALQPAPRRMVFMDQELDISASKPLLWYKDTYLALGRLSFVGYSAWAVIVLEALLIAVLLRNRKKYKATRRLLQKSQHELEHRVVERTDKLRALNKKLYDVIARHETTEELLRESQDYVNSIINSMPSVLIGVTPSGAVTQWNTGAEESTGIAARDALGHDLFEIQPKLPVSKATINEAIDKHTTKVLESVQTPDGRFVDISVFPLTSHKLPGAVIRIDDMTMRIQLEQMMIQTEKMMSLGELAAGTAHEINNPLSAVLQGVQNIERRLSPTLPKNRQVAAQLDTTVDTVRNYLQEREILQFIEGIREAGERASHIVKNMLEFSHSNNPDHHPTKLDELIDQTLELAESSFHLDAGIEFNKINVVKNFAPDVPDILCSGAEIQQVILNLLRNACQALHDHDPSQAPEITLNLRQDNNFVVIEVIDNGPGMAEKTRRRIFEPFFTTKDVGEGTGLGLSVSYFIITEHHNGSIEVDSDPGKGTRFTLRLPIQKAL